MPKDDLERRGSVGGNDGQRPDSHPAPRDGDDRACPQVVCDRWQVRREQRCLLSDVSRSAERRRTTEGRVAPRAAARSSPKSLSAETITKALAAA